MGLSIDLNIFPNDTEMKCKPVADPDFEVRRGPGSILLAQPAFLPSVISSFFTQNKGRFRLYKTIYNYNFFDETLFRKFQYPKLVYTKTVDSVKSAR